jgi:hypothetical protein
MQLELFTDKKLTKVEAFQENVKQKVLSKEITNNFKLYDYVLSEGHIGKHASDCLKENEKE